MPRSIKCVHVQKEYTRHANIPRNHTVAPTNHNTIPFPSIDAVFGCRPALSHLGHAPRRQSRALVQGRE
eukprot:1335855-Amorphochlora_amoeboformis.AAC.2